MGNRCSKKSKKDKKEDQVEEETEQTNIGNTEEPSTSETPIKRQRLDRNTREKELVQGIEVIEEPVSLSASHLNPDHDDQVEQTIPLLHEAASAVKQMVSPCSQSFSSSSSSAPIPDPSTARRPVAAPVASSSSSRSAPTAHPFAATRPVAAPAASSSTSRSAPTPDRSAATRPVAAPAASSSTSSSAPIPDPSAATRPVAAPVASSSSSRSAPTAHPSAATRPVAASSSTSSPAHAAEVVSEPESRCQLPVRNPQPASTIKASNLNPEPLLHEAASAPKQKVSPCSQSFSSSSSSAPIPDPSAATRPVAAPAAPSSSSRSAPTAHPFAATRPVAASSSTSSPAHAAEVVSEPESRCQLPSTSTGGPQPASTIKASNINPEVSKALLHNNRMVLVDNGDFSNIKDRLQTDAILTPAEIEKVDLSAQTRGEKMSKLVDILVLKPGNHVVRFFESLEKADGVLYSQLDMSKEKTRRNDCSSSGKTDHLSIIKEELKDWYKQSMAKIKPMPWCEWLEQDLDHVYTNVRVVEGKKHQISHSRPGVTQYTDEMDTSSLLERVFSPTDERTICFVEGVAGVGKSIFCRRSVYLWSKGEGLDFDLVLLLTANLLKGALKTDIREQLFPDDFDLSADDVYICLQDKKTNVLLVIDGLDEIDINSEGMKCVMQLIQGRILRKVNMLLTGRPEVSKIFVEYARVHLEICGFTDTNVETYIAKCFNKDPNRKSRLLKLLKSHWKLADLARTPFTTLLLCMLSEETDADLPEKIDEIYHQVISLVFQKYVRKLTDRAQGSAHSTSTEEVPGAAETSEVAEITEAQLLQRAARLALTLECENKQNCQEKELPSMCNKADHLLKSGILNRDYTLSRMHDASAYCYFPHRSIQQYLCAWYLSTSTDELAKKINVDLFVHPGIMEFYIGILFRDAQTVLTNVDIALDVVNNVYSWDDYKRRSFEFNLAEALWERIPNEATKEFLVERIFGTLQRALCCLRDMLEERYCDRLKINMLLMEKLLTDGPHSQRSHKYDDSVSLPDVPVVFRSQHCIHHSYTPDSHAAFCHLISYATAITLLPNKVNRLKIDDFWNELCGANICIVLVFEDLHDDSSQRDIFGMFELDLGWQECIGFGADLCIDDFDFPAMEFLRRHRYKRDAYLQREGIYVIRLRPTIRVEAAVHPETKLSRTVSVDCRLKTPFYKMYYDRFSPY